MAVIRNERGQVVGSAPTGTFTPELRAKLKAKSEEKRRANPLRVIGR